MIASGTWTAALWVFVGAGLGACLRWSLGLLFSAGPLGLPWGTLAANFIGGLGIGLGLAALSNPEPLGLSPQTAQTLKLFAITGFLGGLTTFSTFSAEVVDQLMQDRWAVGAAWALLHLLGSLALTASGWAVARWIWPLNAATVSGLN